MFCPNLSALVATGNGESFLPEVASNSDLMVQILTALNAGDSEEACKMAMRWCASHRGACDDALWRDLRVHIFPHTRGVAWPLYAHDEKRWFYMLCHGLEAALAKRAEASVNLSLAAENPHRWPTWIARGQNLDGSRRYIHNIRGTDRDLQFEFDLANLKLYVIMSGRYRKGLTYTKWNVWKPRAGVPPHARPPSAGPNAGVLTYEEMDAQLDRLDSMTRATDDGGGPSGPNLLDGEEDLEEDKDDQ